MTGWWCPLCGAQFNPSDAIKINVPERITAKDTDGAIMYIGDKGFDDPPVYVTELSQAAIIEILERLYNWETGLYNNYSEDNE